MAGNWNSDELYDCDFSANHRLQQVSSPINYVTAGTVSTLTQLRSITRHSHFIVYGGLTGVR